VGRGIYVYVNKATGTWSMMCGWACVYCVCLPDSLAQRRVGVTVTK